MLFVFSRFVLSTEVQESKDLARSRHKVEPKPEKDQRRDDQPKSRRFTQNEEELASAYSLEPSRS